MDTKKNWLSAKKEILSATDYTTIMSELKGYKTFKSTYELIHEKKVMTLEQYLQYQEIIQTQAMKNGKKEELNIVKLAQEELGLIKVLPIFNELVYHKNKDLKAACSPDAFILDENDNKIGVLEVKLTTHDFFNVESYQDQVKYQLFCSGLTKGILFVAKKINNELTSLYHEEITLTETENKYIEKTVKSFWKNLNIADISTLSIETERDKALALFLEGYNDPKKIVEEYVKSKELEEQLKQYSNAEKIIKTIGLSGNYNINGRNYNLNIVQGKDVVVNEAYKAKKIKEAENLEIGTIARQGSKTIKLEIIK